MIVVSFRLKGHSAEYNGKYNGKIPTETWPTLP